MKGVLLRLPENIKQELETIKGDEARPIATIIREAIAKYLKERRRSMAFDWFRKNSCSKCENNCEVGSIEMIECLIKKYEELKAKIIDEKREKEGINNGKQNSS